MPTFASEISNARWAIAGGGNFGVALIAGR
jgi:hypothetical protein